MNRLSRWQRLWGEIQWWWPIGGGGWCWLRGHRYITIRELHPDPFCRNCGHPGYYEDGGEGGAVAGSPRPVGADTVEPTGLPSRGRNEAS